MALPIAAHSTLWPQPLGEPGHRPFVKKLHLRIIEQISSPIDNADRRDQAAAAVGSLKSSGINFCGTGRLQNA